VDEEYISLDEALRELGIREAELRAMVTRGQLRVFGQEGEERFRRSAIEDLKNAANAGQTIVPGSEELDAEPLPILGDEDEPLPFLDDERLASDSGPETLFAEDESPTEVPLLADDDEAGISDTVLPTIEFSPDDAETAGVDDEHTDVATQEVSLTEEDYLILEEDKAPTSALEQPQEFAPAGPVAEADLIEEEPPGVAYEEPEPEPHGLQTVLLAVLTIFMLVSMIVFTGAATEHMSKEVRETVTEIGAGIGLVGDGE
jgi:hypothetical protein